MAYSDLLAIVGLILTVVFGICGIVMTIRKRYPGRITFVEENAIGLFNSVTRSFSEIRIQYNDLPISEQMVYLKACFINTGSIDLSTKDNVHKLKIELPNNYKWINCKIVRYSNGIECSLSGADGKLILDFDLLRKNEFIQFEAFAEIKNIDRPAFTFRKSLRFSHRIPNTAKVDKYTYFGDHQIEERRFEARKSLVFVVVLLVAFFGFALLNASSSRLEYKYRNEGKEYVVKVFPVNLDKIKISDRSRNFEREMSIDEFNSHGNLEAFITTKSVWGAAKELFIFLILAVICFAFMIKEYRVLYRDKKIKNIIEIT